MSKRLLIEVGDRSWMWPVLGHGPGRADLVISFNESMGVADAFAHAMNDALSGTLPPVPVKVDGEPVALRSWRATTDAWDRRTVHVEINWMRLERAHPVAALQKEAFTHCGARPSGRVLSRYCALDGHSIETHGADPRGDERCGRSKGHAGDHEDHYSLTQWPQAPVVERRARESALVALVAAVPEGLDPVGWRSAVLAAAEKFTRADRFNGFPTAGWRERLACALLDEARAPNPPKWQHEWNGPFVASARLDAVAAYRRAIAPATKVQPERKGATWRSRGPVVVVDRGDDE